MRLSDFRGEKNVVLLFYPFAFTGVCTGELCALRDELPQFVRTTTPSCSPSPTTRIHTLRVFAEQEGLEYPLLSDFWPHGEASRAYGVFDEDKGCAVRGTFVIDKEGVVRWTVVNGLPDARDLNEYVKALDSPVSRPGYRSAGLLAREPVTRIRLVDPMPTHRRGADARP